MKLSTRQMVRSACAVLVLLAPAAHAQWRVGIGVERYDWKEDISPIRVKETGPLASVFAEYTQRKESGLVGAYRGRMYGGQVDYDGALLFPPNTPVEGKTRINGMTHEGQLRYRSDMRGRRSVDLVAGVGVDIWNRELTAVQKEHYVIGFARLGIETEARGEGWMAGIGMKFPFYTHENAYLTDFGAPENPPLKPGKEISPYLHVGYQFAQPVSLVLYVDSFRFSESTAVTSMGFYQPASTQYRVGAKLMYQFR